MTFYGSQQSLVGEQEDRHAEEERKDDSTGARESQAGSAVGSSHALFVQCTLFAKAAVFGLC